MWHACEWLTLKVSVTNCDFGILKPRKYCSWLRPIMIAAAEVKPEMTWGRGRGRGGGRRAGQSEEAVSQL